MTENADIQEANKKMDLLLKRMEVLEKLISTILGSQELVNALGLLRMSGELYCDYSFLSSRIAKAQKRLRIKEIASDDLMTLILRTIVVRGPSNISQITRTVRQKRGKASRRIIALKLQTLEKLGAVEIVEQSSKKKVYDLS
jgi:hypothetical protein